MGLAFSKFEKINGSEVSQKIQAFFLSGCYRYDLNHQLYNFFSNSFGLANLILHVCDLCLRFFLSHGGEDTHEDT